MASLGTFLQGYETARQGNMAADNATIQQAGALQQLFAKQQAAQQEHDLRGVLAQSGGDPTRAMQALLKAGTPKAIELAAALKGLMPKPAEPYTIGNQRRGANNELLAEAPFRPTAVPTPSNLARLQSEKAALPPGDPRHKAYDDAIIKETQTAKQISPTVVLPRPEQPLVPIVGPDGKPRLVRREEAVGATPWAAGSAQDKKQEQVESGRATVNSLVATLRDQYEQLGKAGGITDPSKGAVSNIGAGIASSGLGQFTGRVLGTQNQSLRNQIMQQRPLLLNAIKQATGMSAKQMDSNAELKLYLAASTDPTLDIKANLAALDKIDELYGLGEQAGSAPAPTPNPSSDGKFKEGQTATNANGVKIIFKGGVWRPVTSR